MCMRNVLLLIAVLGTTPALAGPADNALSAPGHDRAAASVVREGGAPAPLNPEAPKAHILQVGPTMADIDPRIMPFAGQFGPVTRHEVRLNSEWTLGATHDRTGVGITATSGVSLGEHFIAQPFVSLNGVADKSQVDENNEAVGINKSIAARIGLRARL